MLLFDRYLIPMYCAMCIQAQLLLWLLTSSYHLSLGGRQYLVLINNVQVTLQKLFTGDVLLFFIYFFKICEWPHTIVTRL